MISAAQSQHGQWFFGFNGGLDFNTVPPSPLAGNPITTDEGGTSICDSAGQLLFYTNGEQVIDRTHSQMPNGFGLAGHWSSSQSALVVPFVDDPDRYYVFTVPAEVALWGGPYSGLAYSVVDMTMNGGLGDVALKNMLLGDSMTEKLTAVRHANGRDIWVLTHKWNSNAYFAYLVTCTGVEGPVVSNAGRRMEPDPPDTGFPAIGCMDISPQGDHLVATWTTIDAAYDGMALIDILSFDDVNGTIALLDTVSHGGGPDNLRGYGVQFAPNGRFVYVSENGLIGGGLAWSAIKQYDMNAIDISASEVTVATGVPEFGSLQMAPDGRLYTSRLSFQTYLSCIPFPDLGGLACGFIDVAAIIAGQCTWGLPNHWDTYPQPVPMDPIALTDTLVCGGSILLDATIDEPLGTPVYLWNTGETSASIVVVATGTYDVTVFLRCDTLRDTVEVAFGGIDVDLGPDQRICEGTAVIFTGPSNAVSTSWSDGTSGPMLIADEEALVWIQVTDSIGCVTGDTAFVEVSDCDCDVFVPNSFTPDGGGLNDTWAPVMECDLLDYTLAVYDRWGREIFSTHDPAFTWNGSAHGVEAPTGVYVYRIDHSWSDGSTVYRSEAFGHVTLLR